MPLRPYHSSGTQRSKSEMAHFSRRQPQNILAAARKSRLNQVPRVGPLIFPPVSRGSDSRYDGRTAGPIYHVGLTHLRLAVNRFSPLTLVVNALPRHLQLISLPAHQPVGRLQFIFRRLLRRRFDDILRSLQHHPHRAHEVIRAGWALIGRA